MSKPTSIPKCEGSKAELKLHTDDESLAKLAHGLGHPARVAIIRLLQQRHSCICGEIVDRLPLAQSTVSQHLRILQKSGWIQGEVDGPRVCYCLDPSAPKQLTGLLASLLGDSDETT